MSRDRERRRQFTRRTLLLAGGQTLLLTALAGRLYYLQVVESARYKTLAEDNRINLRLLPPARGYILDRRGRPLAANKLDYRVVIVAEQAGDVERTLQSLGKVALIADGDVRRVLKETRRKRSFVPVTVRDNLTWEDVARIEVDALDLPGIAIEAGQTRFYPHDHLVSHAIGYVAAVSEDDQGDDPLLQLPGFRVGRAGLEKVYDQALRGTSGRSQVEVNAVGRVIRELERSEARPGANLILALDIELQQFAYDRFGDEVGSAVVIDVQSGDVLALVSNPGYDPNMFERGLTTAEWQDLVRNPRGPLINKAISGEYAPGSTFKPVVALAGLESGAVTPATRVFCRGVLEFGNAEFHCWRRGGHGSVDMRLGISQSCDIYFYEVARRTGVDAISAMANRLGLGVATGIDLPAEKAGLMPTRAWKLARFGTSWQQGETLVAGIGQGYVLATPLQLAVMAARIANGTQAVVPRLAHNFSPPTAQEAAVRSEGPFPRLQVNPANLRVVQDGMIAVVNAAYGTARSSAIHDPNWLMAGKTGTSQVRRITRAERLAGVRKNESLPWEKRDHALFIGYAPIDAPRFAVAVIVEHGGGGSHAAAPIARDILLKLRELDAQRPSAPPIQQAATPPGPAAQG